MSEEAGFVAALVAEPSDQTAALVFADWLDERGDPRGPMLRNEEVRAWLHPKYENPLPKLRAAVETGKKIKEAGKTYALIGEPAVPDLISLLGHEVPLVRLRAMKALSQMGEKARGAIPALLDVVKGSSKEDTRVRREAVRLLGALKVKESARDELAKGLDSADAAERLTAVEAIAKLDMRTKAVGHSLCKALADESAAVRRVAAERLRYVASPSMSFAVEPLCKALSDPSAEVRSFAVVALGRIGPKAASAAPDLLRVLNEPPAPPEGERRSVLQTLLDIKARPPEVLDVLLAALRDPATMQLASQNLPSWGDLPPSALPGLLAAIRNPPGQSSWFAHVTHTAFQALARVRPRPQEVWDELRAQLATDNARHAADVLAGIGPEAASFLPELIAAFQRPDPRPGQAPTEIARALGKIGGAGIPALAAALDRVPTKDDPLPAAAADGLATAGAAARPALPALQAQLRRLRAANETFGRDTVIRALVAIGADAVDSIPDIVAVALEEGGRSYSAAFYVQSLRAFGPAVLPFLPQLTGSRSRPMGRGWHGGIIRLVAGLAPHGCDAVPILRDALRQATASYVTVGYGPDNYELRQVGSAVIAGLLELGSAAEAAIPELILADQTFDYAPFRREMFAALGKIGGAAVPHLRAALTGPDPDVRGQALAALAETGDASTETRNALRALGADEDENVRSRAAALLKKLPRPAAPNLRSEFPCGATSSNCVARRD